MPTDHRTITYYETHAATLAAHQREAGDGIAKYFPLAFAAGARILDIGSGSGRDLAALVQENYAAYGVEPSAALRAEAEQAYPQLTGRLHAGALPDLQAFSDASFDGLLCSAVLMQLPREALFDAVYGLRRILKPNGRLLVSVPRRRDDVGADGRDAHGRYFNGIVPEELVLLFERTGFQRIGQWDEADSIGRGHVWAVLLFERRTDGLRSLDQIESILSRDKKTATYKLALLRALCDLALHAPRIVKWRNDHTVAIPLRPVAELWLQYYWPLFEGTDDGAFIPQLGSEASNRSGKVAFRRPVTTLVRAYARRGGLTEFLVALRAGELEGDARVREALQSISKTIVAGPITYAGGSLGARVFRHEKGWLVLDAALWREFNLTGHWIEDALVLRWAQLAHQFSKEEVPVGAILDRLVVRPDPDRETQAARQVFAQTSDLACVWTGKRLTVFDVDHVLPYSLWHNNDLWNLLPAAPAVNAKKRDRIPTRALLAASQARIFRYWDVLQAQFPQRFGREAERLLGTQHRGHAELLGAVSEAAETTALQRGVERFEG